MTTTAAARPGGRAGRSAADPSGAASAEATWPGCQGMQLRRQRLPGLAGQFGRRPGAERAQRQAFGGLLRFESGCGGVHVPGKGDRSDQGTHALPTVPKIEMVTAGHDQSVRAGRTVAVVLQTCRFDGLWPHVRRQPAQPARRQRHPEAGDDGASE